MMDGLEDPSCETLACSLSLAKTAGESHLTVASSDMWSSGKRAEMGCHLVTDLLVGKSTTERSNTTVSSDSSEPLTLFSLFRNLLRGILATIFFPPTMKQYSVAPWHPR